MEFDRNNYGLINALWQRVGKQNPCFKSSEQFIKEHNLLPKILWNQTRCDEQREMEWINLQAFFTNG